MKYINVLLEVNAINIGTALIDLGREFKEVYVDHGDYISVDSVAINLKSDGYYLQTAEVQISVPIHQQKGLWEVLHEVMLCTADVKAEVKDISIEES